MNQYQILLFSNLQTKNFKKFQKVVFTRINPIFFSFYMDLVTSELSILKQTLLKSELEMKEILSKKIALPTLEFSGDSAIAVLLLSWVPEFSKFEILRTNDPEKYRDCGIKLIFEDKYDHNLKWYSRQIIKNNKNNEKKISVSGLIFNHYGKKALISRFPQTNEDPTNLDFILNKLYLSLIKPFDEKIDSDISRLAQTLNPLDDPDPFMQQYYFEVLISHIEEQFLYRIDWIMKTFIKARKKIKFSIEESKKSNFNEVLYIDEYLPILPNKDLIDPDESKKPPFKFIIMNRSKDDFIIHTLKWRNNRTKFALGLKGKFGDGLNGVLQNVIGIGWVHPNCDIGGYSNLPSAIELIKQSLKMSEKI